MCRLFFVADACSGDRYAHCGWIVTETNFLLAVFGDSGEFVQMAAVITFKTLLKSRQSSWSHSWRLLLEFHDWWHHVWRVLSVLPHSAALVCHSLYLHAQGIRRAYCDFPYLQFIRVVFSLINSFPPKSNVLWYDRTLCSLPVCSWGNRQLFIAAVPVNWTVNRFATTPSIYNDSALW